MKNNEDCFKKSLLDESIKNRCFKDKPENRFGSWCDNIIVTKNRNQNKDMKFSQLKKPRIKSTKKSHKFEYENIKSYMTEYRKSKGYFTSQEKTRFEGIRLVSDEKPKIKLPEIDISSLRKKLAKISKSELGYHKSISTSKSTLPSLSSYDSNISNTIQFKNGFLTDTLSQKKIFMIYKDKQTLLSNKIFKIEDKLNQLKEVQELPKNVGNQNRQNLSRPLTDLKFAFNNFRLH